MATHSCDWSHFQASQPAMPDRNATRLERPRDALYHDNSSIKRKLPMAPRHSDDRSPARHESDERIASEPRLPPPAVAPGQMAVPLETFTGGPTGHRAPDLAEKPRSGMEGGA